jgi:WD40 repeat protein
MMKTVQESGIKREMLVAALLTAWESEGNMIGTDTYIELNNLLNRIPQDEDVTHLKTLIAPILVHNAQEQNDFYQLFDTVLNQTIANNRGHSEAIKMEESRYYWQHTKYKTQRFFQNTLLAFQNNLVKSISISVAILAVLFLLGKVFFSQKRYEDVRSGSKIGELTTVCFKLKEGDKITDLAQKTGIVKVFSLNQNEPMRCCLQYQPLMMGKDTIFCQITTREGHLSVLNICINALFAWHSVNSTAQPKKPVNTPSVSKQEKDNLNLSSKLNFLQDSTKTEEINGKYVENYSSSWEFGFGNAYFSVQKALIVLASLISVLLLGSYYRYKRQKFTLVQQARKEDLYNWTIKIPASDQIGMDAHYYIALSELRQRQTDESQRIDIGKTVRSTIENAGLIDFKYKTQFLSKKYLVFIEKNTPLSLQVKLYEFIADSLIRNEVPMQVFLFSSDSFLCWQENDKNSVPIQDIQHKHGDAQIIVFSDGHSFIDGYMKVFKKEAMVFTAWRKRVLLTPTDVATWGENEDILAQKFRLLPATSYGLSLVVETLEAVDPKDYTVLKNDFLKKTLSINLPAQLEADFLPALENQLTITKAGRANDYLLCWLAACAIPPVLFWDWTLYVGQKLSEPSENFLTIENLSILCNLPWFKEGKMPDDVRGVLIKWLEKEHPTFYLSILKEWSTVLKLEDNMPPRGSLDWYGHRIQLILAELLQNPKKKEQRRLELELDNLLSSDMVKDAMVVQYLDTKKTPMDNVLTERFRKFTQVRKNILWRWRDWTWQTPSVLGVVLATLLVGYTEPVTTFSFGENITALTFAPDSKSFLAASGKGDISICDLQTQLMQGVKTKNNVIHINTANNATDLTIYGASTEGNIMQWQQTGNSVATVLAEGGIKTIAVLPNTQKILVGYYSDNTAKLFDLSQSDKPITIFQHNDALTDVCFSADGSFILTASRDNTAKLWSSEGTLIQTFRHKDIVHSVDISPDGTKILTGSRDNSAKLWNRDGVLLQTLEGHDYDVLDVHFSPNGQMLLTASGDKTAKLWSIDGRLLRTLRGHLDYINTAAFSPDNKMAITGDSDGKVKVWTLVK